MFVCDPAQDMLVPLLYTALPLIGALLLLENVSQKRRLEKKENMAAILIFGGFLLFIAWDICWVYALVGLIGFVWVIILSVIRRRRLPLK